MPHWRKAPARTSSAVKVRKKRCQEQLSRTLACVSVPDTFFHPSPGRSGRWVRSTGFDIRKPLPDRLDRGAVVGFGTDPHHLPEDLHRHHDVLRPAPFDFQKALVLVHGVPLFIRQSRHHETTPA